MAESLHQAGEFIGKHKVLLGVGGAAVLLWLLLKGGGSSGASSGSGGGNVAQIAQLEAAQNIQMAQLQAQQNTASLSASVQQNQNNDALQAAQDQLAAQVTGTAFAYKAQSDQTSAQRAIYEDLINTGAQEQLATLGVQENLGSQAIALSGHDNYKTTAANELALILGQGNIGSFNQANASENIASTITQGSIIKGVLSGASSVVGGLF